MSADVVIRGGIVVDGSGEPGREADVAITGDRISGIGSGLSGKVELDASGQVVAPASSTSTLITTPRCSGIRP